MDFVQILERFQLHLQLILLNHKVCEEVVITVPLLLEGVTKNKLTMFYIKKYNSVVNGFSQFLAQMTKYGR